MRSAWSFTFEPLFAVLGAVALVAYVRAWRHEGASALRLASFGAGVLLIVAALNSPLETIAVDYLVLFHLLQNVIISDWAPPLLLIGLTPAMRSRLARRGGRPFAFLTRPDDRAPGLARGLVRGPPRRCLRPRPPPPVAPQRGAPVHDRDRAALLVADLCGRAAFGADAGPDRVRLRGVRRARPSSASRSPSHRRCTATTRPGPSGSGASRPRRTRTSAAS